MILIVIAVIIVEFSGLCALQDTNESGFSNIDVNLDFRSLQPGEIVRVSVKGNGNIKQAEVLFLGKTYIMGHGQDPDHWLAFLGLDLGIKKGTFPIEISLLFNDGHHQNIRREILIQEKEFPLKKLWVKQEFLPLIRKVFFSGSVKTQLWRSRYLKA